MVYGPFDVLGLVLILGAAAATIVFIVDRKNAREGRS